jgi:hypothetical protein
MGVMSDPSLQFPEPEASDADDVVLALETAGALWKRGDALEGIRWLRRAAEAAEEAGDDLRAVALARAAADFTSAGGDGGRRKDSSPPAPEPKLRRLPEAPPLAKRSSPAGAAPKAPAPVESTQDLPAPPPRRHVASPSPAQKPAPAPGSSPSTQRPPPAPSQRPRTPSAARGEAEAMTPLAQLAAMAKNEGTPTPTTRMTKGTSVKALRVAVERGDEDGELIVRILDEDSPLPSGTQSAVLVGTESALDQVTRRRS